MNESRLKRFFLGYSKCISTSKIYVTVLSNMPNKLLIYYILALFFSSQQKNSIT